ncbi:2-oxo-4-hydroxy-4-carboxy-5-ureidoimidazoline decarboxylase [Demequina sp.]|uniref:2-oxo-4-hydroxy-4-carboxy-5-ureidoimidazoline decarboxylase n=1 Tax=Demequina sp. TaxID=2050685 RepID=UPI0025B81B94|nr:2-oxo-4-hydroxy-4-carboxy-5-ureidoimidazoline decarboxylase [Demequina sp.]
MTVTPRHEELLECLRIERWAEDLSGQSYGTMLELERTAVAAATPLTTAEIDEALAAHPPIGEQAADGGADDAGLARRMAAGAVAYQERFGRVFVINAAGRASEEIVAELERRLTHDDVAELAETADQLRGIALVRLRAAYKEQFDQ